MAVLLFDQWNWAGGLAVAQLQWTTSFLIYLSVICSLLVNCGGWNCKKDKGGASPKCHLLSRGDEGKIVNPAVGLAQQGRRLVTCSVARCEDLSPADASASTDSTHSTRLTLRFNNKTGQITLFDDFDCPVPGFSSTLSLKAWDLNPDARCRRLSYPDELVRTLQMLRKNVEPVYVRRFGSMPHLSNRHYSQSGCGPPVTSAPVAFRRSISEALKLPQIMKMYESRSGAGLSFASQLFELTAYTLTAMYSYARGFHFSAWGEAFFLAFQSILIISLLLCFDDRLALWVLTMATYCVACALYFQDYVSVDTLALMQTATVALLLVGRALQARENYRNQSTGQLSAITFCLLTLGGVARVFTSIQEIGDPLIVGQYSASALLNAVICCQIYIYWGRKMPLKKE